MSLPCTENRTFLGNDGDDCERGGTGVQAPSLQDNRWRIDFNHRSRPMFHGQLRNIPNGTWGFPGPCSTASYEMFQMEHDGFGRARAVFVGSAGGQTDSAHVMNPSIVLGFDRLCGLPERRISMATGRGSPGVARLDA